MSEFKDKQKLSKESAENASSQSTRKSPKVDAAIQNFTQKAVQEPPKKKHGWVSIVLLLAIIALGIYFMVRFATSAGEDEILSLGDILSKIDVSYALISLAVLLSVMFLEALKFAVITRATTGKLKPLNSIKVAMLGKYYDDITPFGSGGQPMQIYYLHKKGYSTGVSTAIIMIKYFTNMVCWLLICFALMLFNRNALNTYVEDQVWQNIFMIAGWIGWVFNALMPASIIFFAIFPKMTNSVLLFFINIGTKIALSVASRREHKTGKSQMQRKIKILRRKEKWIKSAHTAVGDFRSSFIVMSHKPFQFLLLILTCFCEQFLTWAFPYFILVAFAGKQVAGAETMFAIMTLNVFVAMSVSVVPTPGNSGVMENFILVAFKSLAKSALIGFWVVFTWRFLTYYIYILIGIGITVFEVIRKAVRNKRAAKITDT